ncbi:formyltetrahydrofolate deformylase [Enteractinococcus helveticum]|uniref:formyltetrahydrofolate deformylase n=1 Tax=Enteractinococcus helveticum TaxID=1837282 RepID=UPI0009EF1A3E|nr:formyltetrahydrofolate deformylase [Enteractinococcus helveticum]
MSTTIALPVSSSSATALLPTDHGLVVTVECRSTLGVVHAVSGVLLEHGYNIMELHQFNDIRDERFYLRIHAEPGLETASPKSEIARGFQDLAAQFGMTWQLRDATTRTRTVVMVSKFEHCLNDLLFRTAKGELPIDIAAVVSNHSDHQRLVEWHGIPFFHIPVTPETKPEAEAQLIELAERMDVELVVLARYMQVLSDELSTRWQGRVINIHHSFLPSFKGAKPYHQAFERGVKTIGATAHYVNSELDEGPIIAQRVTEVDHAYSPEALAAVGRETECKALSEAVRWHAESRVFLAGAKTVVLK